ncbi:uncharacterized protein BDZ99DRAFT_516596 [Mytilinidion resinicola]|uniref:RRM domain-containing protein n=1 Tax=Mytilinidion resinicola TaxID=574789 RepID=A0A6A6YYH3_9PEZI|nr:uncharacterized protein BDZ99DRAFT_516596 [Mytilinidion resinicola]KAF2813972.1 hypothetical protein BDZ99DRAFT_516596 [Mytilinidion resinicola]
MAAGKEAASFDAIIQESRKRKKNEALANEIFGRGKKGSGAGIGARKNPAQTPSLASRVGITKRSASAAPKPNVNGKWGHDLHSQNNPRARVAQLPRTASTSRIEQRGNRFLNELRSDEPSPLSAQANIRGNATNGASGISIRGMAGPYTVIASNFAPGTTAADIEAVMAPIGGEMLGCKLVSKEPTVIAEMMFVAREGVDNVIATFNNKKADGRLLYVYMKYGPPSQPINRTPTGPIAQAQRPDSDAMDVDERDRGRLRYDSQTNAREEDYSDGRYGFNENGAPAPPTQPRQNYRRGRGGYRG